MRGKNWITLVLTATLTFATMSLPVYAQQSTEEAVHFMNGAKPAMLDASFWVGDSGKKELLSAEEIKTLNARTIAVADTNMNALENMADIFDGVKMKASLSAFENPKKLYLDEKPVPDSYYETIRANIAGAKASASMPVGYGLILNRTVMKSLPYAEFLSDSLGDSEWDNLVNASALVNEPVLCYIKTADGKFTYVKSECCEGWIPSEDVVLCHNKQEWKNATSKENILVVTADRIVLEASNADTMISGKCLDMGTILPLAPATGMVDNRMQWYNYVVLLPSIGPDGYYMANPSMIPINRDVHAGFLPLTQENIINQSMKCLGDRYGWGGMLDSRDCSSFVREVYLCFGLSLPRNTTWQAKMPANVVSVKELNMEQKKQFLEHIPAGAIVQFPGHEMLYLGKSGEDYYTINDVSSIIVKDANDKAIRYRGRGVIINGMLDAKRANGHSWMEELTNVIVPWE